MKNLVSTSFILEYSLGAHRELEQFSVGKIVCKFQIQDFL